MTRIGDSKHFAALRFDAHDKRLPGHLMMDNREAFEDGN